MINGSEANDGEVISDLIGGGRSSTPAHVLWQARRVCKTIGEYLGPGHLAASIVPHGDRTIIVYLHNRFGQQFILTLALDMEYLNFPPVPLGDGRAHSIGVPDLVEAIHFIGIVLQSVNASIVGFGQRDKERCGDTLRSPLEPGCAVGRMALCEPNREPLRALASSSAPLDCVLSMDGNFTPVEVFNWACSIARQAKRKIGSGRVTGELWGLRNIGLRSHLSRVLDDRDHAAFSDFSDQEEHSISQRIVLRLRSNPMRSYVLMFIARDNFRLTEHVCAVRNIMQSLHLIGMILEATNSSIEIVSSSKHELNEQVLTRPLDEGQLGGIMVSAFNFVSPDTTRYP